MRGSGTAYLRRCLYIGRTSQKRSRIIDSEDHFRIAILKKSPTFSQGLEYFRCFSHRSSVSALRRRRPAFGKYKNPDLATPIPTVSGMDKPFEYTGDSIDEYSDKANLSPWTPVPDSVARKIFDRADPQEDDVHVELGSGDGRVNFYAIESGVKQSIGFDVDADIVQVANDRLNRIHPKPNIHFVVADLMDGKNPAWEEVSNATILTMYFAKEGLEKIRPLIERALQGRRCKVFTCGYPMPGWESQVVETVLDMPIHFYDWGNTEVENSILTDSVVANSIPEDFNPLGMDKFLKKKNSTFKADLLKGYTSDTMIDYHWDDFDDLSPEENETK